MHPLAPAIRTVWRIKLALLWSMPLIGVLIYDVLHLFTVRDRLLPPGAATSIVLVCGIAACVLIPPLRYRYWRYALQPDELYLERGVLNRVRTIVPLRRIQHLDVSQNLLEREFDLGKLIVHTAGTRSSDVVLPGLRLEEAEGLRDQLKRYILADTGESL